MARHELIAIALSTIALASASCVKHDTETQITIALTSEALVPAELNAIEIQVFGAGGALKHDQVYEVTESRFFPTTLAVIPSDSNSLSAPVTIEVRGILNGSQLLLLRRAVISFVEGRSLYLPMPLRMACFEQTHCNATESCIGGACLSATVDSSSLADYNDDLVFDTATRAVCFHEDTCLAAAAPIAISADCTFPLPAGPNVNLAIQWAAAPKRIIALDGDDGIEGWTQDGAVGRLGQGLCQALNEPATGGPIPDKAIAAWLSVACPPKKKLTPFCRQADGSAGSGSSVP